MSITETDELIGKVRAILAGIESGNRSAVQAISPGPYKQHNFGMSDGRAGFEEALNTMPANTVMVSVIRAFRDGDCVVTHEEYDFPAGSQVGFDVFRFENGLAAEHWDNLEDKIKENQGLTPSGHTQLDGPTEVRDVSKTASNKALVRQFVQETHVEGQLDRLESYFAGDRFIQHDPRLADGVAALRNALEGMSKPDYSGKIVQKIHKILGEGNFVLVMSEGSFKGKQSGLYDLFLVEDDKLAEHWGVIQEIPPRSEWKNPNGKF